VFEWADGFGIVNGVGFIPKPRFAPQKHGFGAHHLQFALHLGLHGGEQPVGVVVFRIADIEHRLGAVGDLVEGFAGIDDAQVHGPAPAAGDRFLEKGLQPGVILDQVVHGILAQPGPRSVGRFAAGDHLHRQQPFLLDHDLARHPAVQGDAERGPDGVDHLADAQVAADLLVGGDQHAEREVLLGFALGAQPVQVRFEHDQGEGRGVLVVDGAATEQFAVADHRLEPVGGGVDHVDVGHEQHRDRLVPAVRHDQNGRVTVVLEAGERDPMVVEIVFDKCGAAGDRRRVAVHGRETDQRFGEGDYLLHGCLPL